MEDNLDEYLLLYICIDASIKTMVIHKSADINMLKNAILTLFFYSWCQYEIKLNIMEDMSNGPHVELKYIEQLSDGTYIEVVKQ